MSGDMNSTGHAAEPDFNRIDAPLWQACAETPSAERVLSIFIHLEEPLNDEQAEHLSALGLPPINQRKRILTATLTPDEVIRLSHLPWIKSLKLSQRLRPLPNQKQKNTGQEASEE